MKNIVKTAGYSLVALTSVAYTNVSAKIVFEWSHAKVDEANKGTGSGASLGAVINSLLTWLLGFLALIAVIFAIYGGFQILTAGGDEEKVKKGKTTLINALIGLFVIWISWAAVSWIFDSLNDGVITWGGA